MNTIGSGLIREQQGAFPSTSMIEVLVQDTSFTNRSIPSNVESSYHFSVISIYNLRYLNIINCTFAMSKQTAVQVFYSTLYFGGHVIFSGNNGTLGMKLNSDSIFYLMRHTHVQITNNYAKRGGGVYIEDETVTRNPPCFFQLMDLHYPNSDIDSVISLENNEVLCTEEILKNVTIAWTTNWICPWNSACSLGEQI